MTRAIEKLLDASDIVKGIALIPYDEGVKYAKAGANSSSPLLEAFVNDGNNSSTIKYYYGARHNLPDVYSMNATSEVINLCGKLTPDDLLVTLVSGGGSALLTQPSKNLSLDMKLDVIRQLVAAGATINELNTVRSSLSQVKGGNLALLARRATIVSLIISDVIDDPISIISSGPTFLDSEQEHRCNRSEESLKVIAKYKLESRLPVEVMNILHEGTLEPTAQSTDQIRVYNYLVGNNRLATEGVLNHSARLGYEYTRVLSNSLRGEAGQVGLMYAYLAFHLISLKLKLADDIRDRIRGKYIDPCKDLKQQVEYYVNMIEDRDQVTKVCLLSGGETTVNLANARPDSKGGRNQEMTASFELAFVQMVEHLTDLTDRVEVLFSSFGTDGLDGPTDAAGAFYEYHKSNDTPPIAEIKAHLDIHDTYNYLNPVQRLIKIGPTGTNVSDLQILLISF